VRDSAALLDAVAGAVPGDPYHPPHQGEPFSAALGRDPGRLRIALQLEPLSGVEVNPECREAALSAARLLEDMGHVVEEARPPGDWEALGAALWVLVSSSVAATVRAAFAAKGRPARRHDVERVTWTAMQAAKAVRGGDHPDALAAIHAQGRRMAEFHESWDMLLTPTVAAPPPPIGAQHTDRTEPELYEATLRRMTAFTQLANLTGQPAMSLPGHLTAEGLPVGAMLVGRFGDEAGLLSLAARMEEARPWVALRAPEPA
jgi:amidase/6-aminohexanoate-cyclic-dimer hydrolase